MIDERNLQRIKKHLEDEAAQERVRHNIQRGRNEVTVTIGRAAKLFGFSESQLRDWERIGLIKPMRPKESSDTESSRGGVRGAHSGQRQYSFTELNKLAIIRELLDEAKLTPGSIPSNIDEIWYAIERKEDNSERGLAGERVSALASGQPREEYDYIDRRISGAYREELCWRYYAAQALMLSLLLVYEEVPGSYAGLILPANGLEGDVPVPEKMPEVGEALVGWLGQTRSFYTFLTSAPAFEYPSDFRVLPLCPPELRDVNRQGTRVAASGVADRTMIVVQRDDERQVNRSEKAVGTVQRLLAPLYEDRHNWRRYFGEGMRDLVNPGIDFTPRLVDAVLTGLANIVIRLGGKKANGENRWRTCCILLPDTMSLPLQQRSLIVRAASRGARRLLGVAMATPERYGTSLTLRAYQGGHIVSRPDLSLEDTTVTFRELEGPVRSNVAVPIGGETSEPLGVLYVASYETNAFDADDLRVLRAMARIIVDLLSTYRSRQQVVAKLVDLLEDPGTVDAAFKEFFSEDEFLQDIEALLSPIKEQIAIDQSDQRIIQTDAPTVTADPDGQPETDVSFIAVDLDLHVQEAIASNYGDQTLARLNKTIGLRIRDLLPALFMNYASYRLYHIYAGRYYLFLRGLSLEKTKTSAERMRKGLAGPITIKQTDLPSSLLTLPEISVHVGVTWYPREKLLEFLDLAQMRSVADVSATLYHSLDFVLKLGTDRGGNIVFAWAPITRTFAPYQPGDEELNKD